MQIYLVGGAVRDQLLGLPVKERDWMVVGTTPKQLLKQGYRPVGKDFPVFLHPETNDEYALARTERKTAPGYKGFVFHADIDVTVEDDLYRRDLTINAMAMDHQGVIIDPYGGQEDLKARVFRHVSPAFSEDPVRILRVARFAARFHHLGFSVAEDTLELMQSMVKNGEAQHLVAERVWKECEKALAESSPEQFFLILAQCRALHGIFPELSNSLKENLSYLSRIDSKDKLSSSRFAALCFNISPEAIDSLSRRLGIPNSFRDFALLVKHHAATITKANQQDPHAITELLHRTDAERKSERFTQLVETAIALLATERSEYLKRFWHAAIDAYQQVDTQTLIQQGYRKAALGEAIFNQRLDNIEQLINAYE